MLFCRSTEVLSNPFDDIVPRSAVYDYVAWFIYCLWALFPFSFLLSSFCCICVLDDDRVSKQSSSTAAESVKAKATTTQRKGVKDNKLLSFGEEELVSASSDIGMNDCTWQWCNGAMPTHFFSWEIELRRLIFDCFHFDNKLLQAKFTVPTSPRFTKTSDSDLRYYTVLLVYQLVASPSSLLDTNAVLCCGC